MSTEKALLITLAAPNPAEMKAMGKYSQASGALAQQYDAKIIARFGVKEQIFGDIPAAIIGVAEFPSTEAIKELFGSLDYQKLIPLRDKALNAMNLYISPPDQSLASIEGGERSLLITLAAPVDMGALQQYQQGAGPLFAKHGGKGVAKISIAENFIGDTPAAFLSIAEFPSDQAIKDFFNDQAYQALIPLRDKALGSLNLYLAS